MKNSSGVFELSPELRLEIASLLYSKWSSLWDARLVVQKEEWDKKFCPKSDWPAFHAMRISLAQKELDQAYKLWQEFKPYAPNLLE